MSPLEQLVSVLRSQNREGIESEDWQDISSPIVTENEDGTQRVEVEDQQVAFLFEQDGSLIGMVNWKE